jgi:hypothetical protein
MIVIEIMEVVMNIFMLGSGLFLLMLSLMGFIFIYDNYKRSRDKIQKGKHTFNKDN